MPLLHPLEAALLGGRKSLALDRRAVDHHGTLSREGVAQRASESAHVMSVDHADVGELELLPPQTRRPERFDRLLHVRPEALERGTDPRRQLGQSLLHVFACVPQLRVQPHAVEVARQGADVRGDRHPVVVEHHDDRRAETTGLVDGLKRHPAGQRAVAGYRHHVGVLGQALAHRLLDAHRIADRGGCVSGAHDVVLGFVDRAERREPAVLADRAETLAPAGEDLVRIGLVTDVPQNLVVRRVQQRVQRDGELARTEVRAEMAADFAYGVDDVLAHFLRELLKLLI